MVSWQSLGLGFTPISGHSSRVAGSTSLPIKMFILHSLVGASEKPKDGVCRLGSHPSLKSQFEPLFKGCGSRRHLLMGEAVENTWPFLCTIIYVLQKEVFFRFRFQLQAVAAVPQL